MNLLLYAEARKILTRPPAEILPSGPAGQWISAQVTLLPDEIFEEMGYYGALPADESDPDPGDSLDELYRWFTEPILSLQPC